MKTNRIITACAALFLLASCENVLKENATLDVFVMPSEGVATEGDVIVVKKGSTVNFQFSGESDFITFYSGESGKSYQHRERIVIDPEEIASSEFSFSVWPQYGNKACTENTMSIYYSEDFGGLLTNDFAGDSVLVEKHEWKELIPQADLPKSPISSAAGAVPFKVDFTQYLGKKIILALVYKTSNSTAAQPTWNFLNMSITNNFKNGEKAQLMPSGFGFTPVNMYYKTLPSAASIKNPAYATVTNNANGFWNLVDAGKGGFKVSGSGAGYHYFYTWLVSKAIVVNACSPDKGEGIKSIANQLSNYSYTYDKVGDYTTTFEGNSANFEKTSSVVREFTIKVVE